LQAKKRRVGDSTGPGGGGEGKKREKKKTFCNGGSWYKHYTSSMGGKHASGGEKEKEIRFFASGAGWGHETNWICSRERGRNSGTGHRESFSCEMGEKQIERKKKGWIKERSASCPPGR